MRNPKISYKLIIGRVMFIQDKPIEKWGTLIFRNFHILRKNGWTMQMWWAIQVVLDQQKITVFSTIDIAGCNEWQF